jgi:hypothetical protein
VISFKAQNVLKKMVAAEDAEAFEDAELVMEGRTAYLGYWRVPAGIVDELLRAVLIRASSDNDGRGLERYTVNEDGRKTAVDRSYVNPALVAALQATSGAKP